VYIIRVLALWLILRGTAVAQYPEIHTQHFFTGYLASASSINNSIIHDLCALSYNDDTKFAEWVTYRVDLKTTSGNVSSHSWRPASTQTEMAVDTTFWKNHLLKE